MPRVSILLPTLNSRPFLAARIESIFSQKVQDWELIICDSYSVDGTHDWLQAHTKTDRRVEIQRTPSDGIYPNINRCLARAQGEFVYIATSDDTMTPDCLAELVAALESHPECDLAQCCLHVIDEHGTVIPGWWHQLGIARFLGSDYLRPHLRRAPYDGVLHSAMHTIYHSLTQLLIRRRAFAKTGPFPTAYGPGGDFCWGMKAGLLCDVVHVPKFLATWRIHPTQASANYRETAAERARMARMVDEALAARPAHSAAARLPAAPLRFPYRFEHYRQAYAEAPTAAEKLRVIGRLIVKDPSVARGAARLIIAGRRRSFDKRAYALRLLHRFGIEKHFVRLPGSATPPPKP